MGLSRAGYQGTWGITLREAPDDEVSLEDNACGVGNSRGDRLRLCADFVGRADGHARPDAGGMNGGMNGGMGGGMNGSMAEMHRQMMQGQGPPACTATWGKECTKECTKACTEGQACMASNPERSSRQRCRDRMRSARSRKSSRSCKADPSTDWSKVNIAALRQHLIDMNEVTLSAAAAERVLDNGIEIAVTGEGRTLEAIKRMVPAHVSELREIGWEAKTDELPNGVKLTVMASETHTLTILKALGFMGIMVQGSHHQPHHLMMAKGQFAMH